MKRWLRALAPLAMGSLLLGLASCEGDQGPAGPPGTVDCMNCHTDNFTMTKYLRPTQDQFAVSRHNLSDTYVRRGTDASPMCSRCHTTEGFQHYVATGEAAPLEGSSHISCFACHAPHTNGDFEQRTKLPDGPGYKPVEMFHGDTYNKGLSNTCAVCHQARPTDPPIDSPTPITSSRWGPHYGPQANILSGTGAHVFAGTTYETQSSHSGIYIGCVRCHMAELPANVIAGGHSFAINYETSSGVRVNSKGCDCHTTWTSDAIATTATDDCQASFEEKLDELGDMLAARAWLSADREYAKNGATAPVTADERGAVFNFLILHHDKSVGVHNKKYAESVVAGTKVWLEAHP